MSLRNFVFMHQKVSLELVRIKIKALITIRIFTTLET